MTTQISHLDSCLEEIANGQLKTHRHLMKLK